jgi:D-glycero-D-manno-heptose 1,7-bisphosphate phosphatase
VIVLEHTGTEGLRHDFAVVLDRDGTVIEDVPSFVRNPDDVRLLPGTASAAGHLKSLDVPLALVSNQSGIGRGVVSAEVAVELHLTIVGRLASVGLPVHLSILCPHHPDDGCACRKPLPGMLLEAARLMGVPAEHTFVVGDAARDMEAAWSAGMPALLVLTGHGADAARALERTPSQQPVEVVADVAAAARQIGQRVRDARG